MPLVHPDDRTLCDYALGKLEDLAASSVFDHLEVCEACRDRASGLSSDSFLGRFREADAAAGGSAGFADRVTGSFASGRGFGPPMAESLPSGLVDHLSYDIKRELGRGGMGVVYLAHNKIMGRDEVLKVMGRRIMDRPGVLERFQREIRAVARLRHPNIVLAYTAFRIEGGLVFAMEYVEGLDLARLVRARGPLSVAHACSFIHQAALGLQHAHEKGMVHRDIKPHNLMLGHDGGFPLVKVLDFGLAKAARDPVVETALTSEGQALGTPDFIAPEQITNQPGLDVRADLYSLGATFFYLLAGRPPFRSGSLHEIYHAHMSRQAEALNLVRGDVPPSLAALVTRLMAKDPARRFQEPREVAEALEPYFRSRMQSHLGAMPRPEVPGSKPAALPVVAERSTLLDGVFHLEGSEGEPTRRARAGRRRPLKSRVGAVAVGIFLLVGVMALGWRIFATRSGAAPGSIAQVPAPVVARPVDQAAALGITMLPLPPGEFTMGAPEEDAGAEPNERPRHRVVIPAGRALSAHEVTVSQFRQFILDSQYVTDAERDGWGGHGVNEKGDFDQDVRFTWQETNFPQTDDHPVVNVSWNDAQEFCRWLTRKDGQTYRLPTEAEWEYACRAGSTTYYSNGDDPENLAGIANLADASAKAAFPPWRTSAASDGYIHTAPVGRFRPNAWGFYDMHGNVMEWCADYYDKTYYEQSPVFDPHGPASSTRRVHRGGSWKFWGGWYNRSSDRHDADPLTRDPNLGFRVARVSAGG